MPEKKKKIPPDAERAMEEYGNSLYRLCSVMTGNREDAQDAVQDCFLRYITKAPDFSDSEHEKAWLIRVASNICHDILRSRKRASFVSLDEIRNLGTSEDNAQILGLLLRAIKPMSSRLCSAYPLLQSKNVCKEEGKPCVKSIKRRRSND